jgi:hypothetical protein
MPKRVQEVVLGKGDTFLTKIMWENFDVLE